MSWWMYMKTSKYEHIFKKIVCGKKYKVTKRLKKELTSHCGMNSDMKEILNLNFITPRKIEWNTSGLCWITFDEIYGGSWCYSGMFASILVHGDGYCMEIE